jgi:hypothetical protein
MSRTGPVAATAMGRRRQPLADVTPDSTAVTDRSLSLIALEIASGSGPVFVP